MNKQQLLSAITNVQTPIIGQHAGAGNFYPTGINTLITTLPKRPGLVGTDLGYGCWGVLPEAFEGFRADWGNAAVQLWEQGSLLTVGWHIQNPWTKGDVVDLNIGKMADLWTPGNAAYTQYRAMLNRVRYVFDWFKARNVPLLFRPLHECNGRWHWYENRAQSDYVRLWHDMYEHLNDDHIVWVYSPNRQFDNLKMPSYYYPGDDVVDICAIDHYSKPTDNEWEWIDESWEDLSALGKPMALGEIGCGNGTSGTGSRSSKFDLSTIPGLISRHAPGAKWAMFWNEGWAIAKNNGINALMSATLGAGEWMNDTPPPPPPPPPETIDLSQQIAALGQIVDDLDSLKSKLQSLEHPNQATAIQVEMSRLGAVIDDLEAM